MERPTALAAVLESELVGGVQLGALDALGVADVAAALGVADAVNAGRKLSAISHQPSAKNNNEQQRLNPQIDTDDNNKES